MKNDNQLSVAPGEVWDDQQCNNSIINPRDRGIYYVSRLANETRGRLSEIRVTRENKNAKITSFYTAERRRRRPPPPECVVDPFSRAACTRATTGPAFNCALPPCVFRWKTRLGRSTRRPRRRVCPASEPPFPRAARSPAFTGIILFIFFTPSARRSFVCVRSDFLVHRLNGVTERWNWWTKWWAVPSGTPAGPGESVTPPPPSHSWRRPIFKRENPGWPSWNLDFFDTFSLKRCRKMRLLC